MAAVIKGRAVKWSVGGVTFTAGIVSATNAHFTQSFDMQRTSDKALIKDTGGTVKTAVFHGFMKTISMNVVPQADTIANAITSLDAFLLAPGTLITVVDSTGTIADGDYNLISAKEGRTVDGVCTIDLELEKGDEGENITNLVA